MMRDYHLKAVMDWTEESVYLFVTPSITAKSMLFYVQEIGHFKTRSRYSTERKHLDSYLAVYTLSGSGYLQYEDKKYTLSPGHAFLIDCNKHQYYETDKNDLWEMVWVHFNGGLSRNYYEIFRSGGDPVITVPQSSPIPDILTRLITVHQNKDVRTELISSNLIMNLLTELILQRIQSEWKTGNTTPSAGYATGQSNQMPDFIGKVIEYMHQHFADKILLDVLASQCAVSKYHLIREFKKYIGSTPNEYLINTRLAKARELLKYSDMPVAEIARTVGFENVSHFIYTFKKQEEVTPLTYRKQWRS